MLRKRICIGGNRVLLLVPVVILIFHAFSAKELLRRQPGSRSSGAEKRKKIDHLLLGPAAGEGRSDRLHCRGTKAMNTTAAEKLKNSFHTADPVALVTVFIAYNDSKPTDPVTVGNVSYSKSERSMAILNIFINFIKISMPRSSVIILTDPISELKLQRDMVMIQPIKGEYSRDKLMLQRIRSYIAFLEMRLQKQEIRTHYVFTDSDMAVVGDLSTIFAEYPNFDLAVTFRNNKEQPLNSGFIAVRGTIEGIQRAKAFLEQVLKIYSSKFGRASRMLGDQLALAWTIRSDPNFDARRFSAGDAFVDRIGGATVLFLPCSTYNWTPPEGAGQFHGMPLDVVHFKGSRKRLMVESWNFFSSSSNLSDTLCLVLRSGRTKYDF
ncbi:hypothetical protein M569_07663 [Genlisea aurea]|uniref:Nucleotide-diphospho-sugar transferase domain-containing protein n=1 Tax=Genlisea aurea TaxID=192259 RepID=S8CK89_9LAMI|nr:hypothetical protein M569_07663 [Genlisea aurea]